MKDVIMQNLRPTTFYMKTNIMQDFHICVPLNSTGRFTLKESLLQNFLCLFFLPSLG